MPQRCRYHKFERKITRSVPKTNRFVFVMQVYVFSPPAVSLLLLLVFVPTLRLSRRQRLNHWRWRSQASG